MRIAAIALACIGVAGCIPTQYTVVYQSYPAGAVIAENGKVWGRAPVALTYQNPNRDAAVVNRGVSCTWDSGAYAETGYVTIDLYKGRRFDVSCARPQFADDLEKDLEVADRFRAGQSNSASTQQLELMRRQTDAAEAGVAIDLLDINLSPQK